MSSNATGDTQPEPAVIADEPAAADVAGPSVAADARQGRTEGTVEGVTEGPLGEVPAPRDGAATEASGEAGPSGDPGEVAGADGAEPESGGTEGTEPGHADEDAEPLALASDADDDHGDGYPAEQIGFSEPVERAEHVEEFRPGKRWPRILLAAGFVMAAAAIVVGAIAIVGSLTHGFKKPVKVTYKKSAVFSLKTGDCLDPQGQSYTLISCDSPHVAEVFATFKLPGAKWPGNTAAATAASNGCVTRLSGYLNPELAISLASTYVYPDAVAWQAGTRTVICEVRASSGQLTGSVRGAKATAS
ncbi:MAG TPA: septum formation family protein [Trebonia sp.]|nr:septum formation family protein [Trebonia sp.]